MIDPTLTYLQRFPDVVPPGQALVHNHVRPMRRLCQCYRLR